MEKLAIAIAVAVAMRFLIALARRAFSSRRAPDLARAIPRSPSGGDEDTLAVCRSSEGGSVVLTGIMGLRLAIDGVAAELDPGAESVSILRVCAGRHSVVATRGDERILLEVLLHPHEDMVRTFGGSAWSAPDQEGAARARRAASITLDYPETILTARTVGALVDDRTERALAFFELAAERVLRGAPDGDAAVAGAISASKPLLDGAGLTKSRFADLVTSATLVVEKHAHEGDRSVGSRLAELALDMLPEEPRLLVQLAEIEAARGNGGEAKILIARARARAAPLVDTGLSEAMRRRAETVLAEADA